MKINKTPRVHAHTKAIWNCKNSLSYTYIIIMYTNQPNPVTRTMFMRSVLSKCCARIVTTSVLYARFVYKFERY